MGYSWAITLETVIIETGELDHLLKLIEKKREKVRIEAGANEGLAAETVDKVINPVLEKLEEHLKKDIRAGMSRDEVKVLVHDWIEEQLE